MKYAITILLLVVGLYVSIAGYQGAKTLQNDSVKKSGSETGQTYEYHGIVFADDQSLMDFVHEQQATRWFGWIFTFPANLILLVGCMAAGLFGGALRIMMRLPKSSSKISYAKALVDPLVGLSIGVVLFFFSLALPAIYQRLQPRQAGDGPYLRHVRWTFFRASSQVAGVSNVALAIPC